jgi:putative membrane protein
MCDALHPPSESEDDAMPMWDYSDGYGMGGMLSGALGILLCLALFGLLIWGLLSLLEGRTRHSLTQGAQPSALEMLQQRYARGEIDEPTFQRMREQLTTRSLVAPSESAR